VISFVKAQALLLQEGVTLRPGIVSMPLDLAQGHLLAEDIVSKRANPAFDYAAMDGFAVGSFKTKASFRLMGEVAAGQRFKGKLGFCECVRIMTGAPVPLQTRAVVPLEEVFEDGRAIHVLKQIHRGQHIRRAGEDFKKGIVILKSGASINALHPGLMATAGYTHVRVFQKLRVGFFTTGSELNNLKNGVINSNRFLIFSILKSYGFESRELANTVDTRAALRKQLKKSLSETDVVITTGGVSAGKYDLLPQVLDDLGAQTLIRKVAIKPGKPFTVSKIGKKIIFSLPGNPGAVVATLYALVLPFLLQVQYKPSRVVSAYMGLSFRNTGKRDLLAFVRIEKKSQHWVVQKVHEVNSGAVKVFNEAQGVLHIPAGQILKKGVAVDVRPII
jgi:molybdopterin molybdotransferase